ncbi:acyltransferase [Sphingobacterium daejeonense]|uniref:acyltransferase n=1 Tax=Sphingobacterium daejeonense TaxID=371142 RepID=UPI0021A70891|nr:acyltransferase [Sphingobacterium daejeonense]MCT1532637.1 acyltransferase [Sphingobacterium daejeonense]
MRKLIYKAKKSFYTFLAYLLSKNSNVFKCHINGYCKFLADIDFGKNNHFNGCKILGNGKVSIGDNFHSAENLIILTTYHNYKGNALPYDHTIINKDVSIGDNVWIGLNVIILGGVKIGEGSIIQAGSVVSKDIEPLGIAGGNPAKVFKYRDLEHYSNLKGLKKYL